MTPPVLPQVTSRATGYIDAAEIRAGDREAQYRLNNGGKGNSRKRQGKHVKKK